MSDIKIPMEKTAIVLIEPQNDFLSRVVRFMRTSRSNWRNVSDCQPSGFADKCKRKNCEDFLLSVPSF
jgi:hypothetical protein